MWTKPEIPSIEKFNESDLESAIQVIDTLFETSLLSLHLASSRPYASYTHLCDTARPIISLQSDAETVLILNSHPRIGSTSMLSHLSRKEQSKDEVDLSLVLEQLQIRNQQYEDRFGFRFVVFVNGRTRSEIIPVIDERLLNSRDLELVNGIEEMILIARDRAKAY